MPVQRNQFVMGIVEQGLLGMAHRRELVVGALDRGVQVRRQVAAFPQCALNVVEITMGLLAIASIAELRGGEKCVLW